MIGIGIDTGGTCTDAVVYDLNQQVVLEANKALTTKEDLKIGISNVLSKLSKEALSQCKVIALSTTLATNACVENKGGHGKLIFIGVDEANFDSVAKKYGITERKEVYLLPCQIDTTPATSKQPDWDQFRKDMPTFLRDCESVSVVQLFSKAHSGSYEKRAAKLIKEIRQIPVILGNDLFGDLNVIRRGAGALLNARLIPVIYEFLTAIKSVFAEKKLNLPTVIVRSDGSLMTEAFAKKRPVETLLCGPAASIIGAMKLSREKDAMIVDMGGTTTDVAIVRNGQPLKVHDGIQIGAWKTFVKGLFVETFGLGGDTAVHYDYDGNLYLEKYRIIPLCVLSKRFDGVIEQLRKLEEKKRFHTFPVYEFLCLQKEIDPYTDYTKAERDLCAVLKNGPLILDEAAAAIGKDIYNLPTERLEKNGVIIRSGITPTDVMHIKGDFNEYDKEASLYGILSIARYAKVTTEEVCDRIYELVTERLYENLVKIMLKEEYKISVTAKQEQLDELIHQSFLCQKKESMLVPGFSLNAVLIAAGAPTHIFLDRVAKLLHTKAVVPKYAQVANAIGAIAGEVVATADCEITPDNESAEDVIYITVTKNEQKTFTEYEDALAYAKEVTKAMSVELAQSLGAKGKLVTKSSIQKNECELKAGTLYLGDRVTAITTGSIFSEDEE